MRPFFIPIIITLLSVAAFNGGCAQQTGTITKAAASYLVFVGDSTGSKVTVDDRPFALTNENSKSHFALSPGVHRIKIEKLGRLVVDREILLSDRQTMEIAIP